MFSRQKSRFLLSVKLMANNLMIDPPFTLPDNKILGKHLPHFLDRSGNLQLQMIERCGLTELCHQLDFKIALESLLESGMRAS